MNQRTRVTLKFKLHFGKVQSEGKAYNLVEFAGTTSCEPRAAEKDARHRIHPSPRSFKQSPRPREATPSGGINFAHKNIPPPANKDFAYASLGWSAAKWSRVGASQALRKSTKYNSISAEEQNGGGEHCDAGAEERH